MIETENDGRRAFRAGEIFSAIKSVEWRVGWIREKNACRKPIKWENWNVFLSYQNGSRIL